MATAEDLAQLVHLEQVAVLPVEPEPPHREPGVVGQLQDITGIVQTLHQVALQQCILWVCMGIINTHRRRNRQKRRRVCLGHGIHSIPYHTTDLALE